MIRILYAWDGRKPLPQSRVEAIEATMALYPEAEYAVITRLPFFVSERFQIINWDALGKEMLDGLGLKNIPFRWLEPVCFSDWARFWYLAHNPNTLYLDTDCRMLKWFCFEAEDRVIHSAENICLLYSPKGAKGGNFLELLRDRTKRYIGILMGIHNRFGAWAKPIPEEYYRHK